MGGYVVGLMCLVLVSFFARNVELVLMGAFVGGFFG